ncbi:MAG: F0F1 ATP synthase subunit gamma [Paludibacteraceae bacterium]|nr:F0F1 ATP synthase subunit gamma [Paludibacteraceae bacterium]MBO7635826.1 F0F1 ATP synthase subunit gamma [Paludibacteraceae bacterium]MBR0502870.1 F0F1 ATP synthase subunit gamma [Paludibacteraceae bacterium]MBR5973298.1 F0F1 ATP synthase subunit gamma [Paludibacteraceae bacterium]
MASLKEVKARIGSVNSTKKITGAMKMVSSAKLKKAQMAIENILPYQNRLNGILENFLATETDFQSDFSAVREVKKMAIVVFSSNSSLCGAFNSNVIKELNGLIKKELANGIELTIYPIGKKVKEAVNKMTGIEKVDIDISLSDHPSFDGISTITNELMTKFLNKEFDKVVLIYHHLKNTAVQKLTTETFLPIKLESKKDAAKNLSGDYIVEPSKAEVLEALLPKALRTKMYACLLDSNASEHGARVVAMQVATDNANELINELTVLYNKTRQQAITSELLDIVGGAAALQS